VLLPVCYLDRFGSGAAWPAVGESRAMVKRMDLFRYFVIAAVFAVVPTTSVFGEGAEAEAFREAADYAKEHSGLGLLVRIDDKVVLEEFYGDHSPSTAVDIGEGTAGVTGLIAAAAATEGLIELDDLASATLTNWQNDPLRSKVTIRQLLDGTSGIDYGRLTLIQLPPNRSWYEAGAKILEGVYEPGERFFDGPGGFHAFGAILKQKLAAATKERVEGFFRRKLMVPLSLTVKKWDTDGAGDPYLFFGLHLTAREWAKVGELIDNDGRYNGQQVIPAKLIKEVRTGSKAQPEYGMGFWLNAHDDRLPKDLVVSRGYGDQLLVVVPSLDLVAVRHGKPGGGFIENTFLRKLVAPVWSPSGEESKQD